MLKKYILTLTIWAIKQPKRKDCSLMTNEYKALLAFVFIMALYLLFSIVRLVKKNAIISNEKLNAILDVTNANYPPIKGLSKKAKKAIDTGDRNKAINLIVQESECTIAQAESVIKLIEQQ